MDTLLFVFTTESGDRESGSVYYANYLSVYGESEDVPAIQASLLGLLDGARTSGDYIIYPYTGEDVDFGALVTGLALDGWQARWVTPYIVTEDSPE